MDTVLQRLPDASAALRPRAMRSSVVLGSLCNTSNNTGGTLWADEKKSIKIRFNANDAITARHILSIFCAASDDALLFDSHADVLTDTPLSVLEMLISRS